MAVLVEAISVIVRRDSIVTKYAGGWDAFVAAVPNSTLCFDDEIARIGFMGPPDVEAFVQNLLRAGLQFLENGKPVDLVVVDQNQGFTAPCDWLEFGKIEIESAGKVSACWFFDHPRDFGAGVYLSSKTMNFATPGGWVFEGSLSQKAGFVPTEQVNDRLKFLRSEAGVDVYLNLETGEEVFQGRTR